MEEIDLKEFFNIFWSKKLFIIIITILFAILGVCYTKYMVVPDYQSTATLVLTKSDNMQTSTITQTEITLNQQLVATYTEIMKTDNVLSQVIQNLGYDDMTEDRLRGNLTVQLEPSTQLIKVSVKNGNPQRAKELTNELVKVFIAKATDIYKLENIHMLDEAKEETLPYNINHKKDVMMFAAIGLVLAMGLVFIRSLFDTTVKNSEEIEKKTGLTVLASIPQYSYEMKKKGKK